MGRTTVSLRIPSEPYIRFLDDYLDVFRPVFFNKQPVGTIYIRTHLQELSIRSRDFAGIAIAFC